MTDISFLQTDAKGWVKSMPDLRTIPLSGVLDSIVCCRVCRGERLVAVKSDHTNKFTYTKCPMCEGLGTMSNRESSYDKRD